MGGISNLLAALKKDSNSAPDATQPRAEEKSYIGNLLSALKKEGGPDQAALDAKIAGIVAPPLRPAMPSVEHPVDQFDVPPPSPETPEVRAERVLAQSGTPLRIKGTTPPVPRELQPEPLPVPGAAGVSAPIFNPKFETTAGEAAANAEALRNEPSSVLLKENPSLFGVRVADEASGRAGYPQIAKGTKELLAGGIEAGLADVGEGAFKAATPLLLASGAASPVKVGIALLGATAGGYVAEKGAKAIGANEDEQRIANLIGSLATGVVAGGKSGFLERRAALTEGVEKNLLARGVDPEMASSVARDAVKLYEASGDAKYLGAENAKTPGAAKTLGLVGQDVAGAAAGAIKGATEPLKEEDAARIPNLRSAIEQGKAEPPETIDHLPALKAALDKTNQSVGAAGIADDFSSHAANINLDRLQTGEDVLGLIRETAKASGNFETQRRGVISHEETATAAEELGLTPEKIANLKPGKALNAEEMLAARRINVATSEDVRQAVKAYQADDSTENLVKVSAAMQKHVAVLNAVSGATAEAGRALSQFRIAASALRERSNYDKVLQSLGGREVTEELTRKLAEIPEDDVVALNKFLRGATKFSTADKISAYWTSSILSGPRTHLRNLVSNITFSGIQIPQKALRGWIDLPLSKLAGRPQEFYAREAIPAAYGFMAGLPDGLRRASYIIRNGFDAADAAKLDSPRQYEFQGAAKVFNIPGRLLVASDAMSKTMLLQSELYALATAAIVANPEPAMVSKAVDFSRYATFNSAPGKFTRQAIGLREAEILGKNFRPLRYLVPFINTPSNIAKIGFEYSPAGFAKLAKVGLRTPESSEVIAKATIGTLAMAGFASLAASGKLTGAAPTDPAKRDAFYRTGKQPFSVKIGNRWVQYNQATGPLSLTLAATAGFWDAFAEKGEIPASKRIATAGSVIGQSIVDATFFRGIENAINALTDPEKQGEKFASDMAGGFVPFSGLTRNIANSLDPTIRDPQSIYERILTGLPIVSQKVPPKLDVFGREQKMEGGEGAMAFLPSRLPKDEPRSAVDAELNRLEIYPGKTSGSLTLKNTKMELTREQKAELQRLTGDVMYRSLESFFSSDGYKELTDEQRQEISKKLIDGARKAGRDAFLGANAAMLKVKSKE